MLKLLDSTCASRSKYCDRIFIYRVITDSITGYTAVLPNANYLCKRVPPLSKNFKKHINTETTQKQRNTSKGNKKQ